jgi:hypothetical protein
MTVEVTKSIASDDSSVHERLAFTEGRQEVGSLRFQSCTTVEGRTSVSTGCMPSNRVVPIIFVPGIMGSNLKAKMPITNANEIVVIKSDEPVWRVDGKVGLAWTWVGKPQGQYQLRFQYDKVAVDARGEIALPAGSGADKRTEFARLTQAQARARGWGTVSSVFYGRFLDWLECELNQPQRELRDGLPVDNPKLTSLKQIATRHPTGLQNEGQTPPLTADDLDVLLKADNPVYAFGYNWLQSNLESGKSLKDFIAQTIAQNNDQGRKCEKVILVTHSMGGLVARAACTVAGAGDQVAGVFHSVMPTDGAAATYKRMVSGFGGEPSHGMWGWFTDWVGALALGPTSDFVTPALALNAGPLELLPNARYNGGKPWLIVKDPSGVVRQLPTSQDPYTEIYLEQSAWWRLLNENWLNPAGLQENLMLNYKMALSDAQAFHSQVQAAGDFHKNTHAHYGVDDDYKAYGTVTWKLKQPVEATRYANLQRELLADVKPLTGMDIYLRDDLGGVHAGLSDPDVYGDGTVPAEASAMRVDQAVVPGNLLVRDAGYSHDASYTIGGRSAGPAAAFQAIVRVLKAEFRA